MKSKKSNSVSVRGLATMTLPIVCSLTATGTITRAVSQVRPPSVVRERNVGPTVQTGAALAAKAPATAGWSSNSGAWRGALAAPHGTIEIRSHTPYAKPGSRGSAVMEFLSSTGTVGSLAESSIWSRRFCQVRPPSTDVTAATPLWLSLALNTRPWLYALPSGPIETHGSDARSNGATCVPDEAAQALYGSTLSCQLRPPSADQPATRPLEPPSLQRSCCQVATRLRVAAGFSAMNGSTSAFGLLTPPKAGSAPTPTQAANGSPREASTRPPTPAADAGAANANASSAANAPESAIRRMEHPPLLSRATVARAHGAARAATVREG